MTGNFFGSPKKKTVKIKSIRFFKIRIKNKQISFFENDRLFFRKPEKNDGQN